MKRFEAAGGEAKRGDDFRRNMLVGRRDICDEKTIQGHTVEFCGQLFQRRIAPRAHVRKHPVDAVEICLLFKNRLTPQNRLKRRLGVIDFH